MPPLTFSILGPLEIRRGEEVVALTGKPAAVLVTLLLRAGDVVSTDSLIDAVWGEEPPETARAALQVHVSKVRKLLALDAGGALATTAGGYVLHVEPDALDLFRFDRLVKEAKDALSSGAPEEARRSLDEAIGAWRGSALEGVGVPGLAGFVAALEDRRREALVLRAEVDLTLGRHRDTLPTLEELAPVHPRDERIAELRALALHRSGRSSDALDVLADLRHELSSELGIAPGAAIERLEVAILAGDPSIDPPREEPSIRSVHRKVVTALVARADIAHMDLEVRRRAMDEAEALAVRIAEPMRPDAITRSGDRLIVTFGVDEQHEDDVSRAIACANEIGAGLDDLLGPLSFGLASGEALVESAGTHRSLHTSDPLDEAERLAVQAAPKEIWLNPLAARLGAPDRPAEEVSRSGSWLTLRFADHERGRARTPLVGRAAELAHLVSVFDQVVAKRRPASVAVVGEAGIGKTRLVGEFVSAIGDRARVVHGRCLPYGRDITLWPVAEVLRSVAGIVPSDPPDATRSKLELLVASDDDASYLAGQTALALGLDDSSPAPDELRWAVRRVLELSALDEPLVVVLEDLQFADDALLSLLGYLTGSARDVPLLTVFLARTEVLERRAAWVDLAVTAGLRLDPLDEESSEELLRALPEHEPLERTALRRIIAAAGGNPLFLTELSRIPTAHGGADTAPPPSLQQLIAARLDRLPSPERSVLDAASVVGEEFSESDVTGLRSELDEAVVHRALTELERRGFIDLDRYLRGSGSVFRFRHLLVRDIAYAALAKEDRAADHARFGDLLEGGAGDRLPEVEEILGYHLETSLGLRRELGADARSLAEIGGRAANHLAAAARRARLRDEDAVAGRLFGRALVCLPPDHPGRVELWWRQAMALLEAGHVDRVEEAITAGLAEAADRGDDTGRLRLLVELENLRWYRPTGPGWVRGLRDAARRLIDELAAVGDLAGMARAERLLHDALVTLGRSREAVEAAARGAALAERAGEFWDRAASGTPHGPTHVDELIRRARRHLDTCSWNRAEMSVVLGGALALKGSADEARLALDAGLARALDVGGELRVADAHMVRAFALPYIGDLEDALASAREAVEVLGSIGEASMRSTAWGSVADVLMRTGRHDEALEATERAERLGADDDHVTAIVWRRVRARVWAEGGQVADAVDLARTAVAVAEQTDFLPHAAEACSDLAEVMKIAGRDDEARAAAERSVELYRQKGADAGVAAVRSRFAER
jgi:DNA-binding SARP family transcriptional activator